MKSLKKALQRIGHTRRTDLREKARRRWINGVYGDMSFAEYIKESFKEEN